MEYTLVKDPIYINSENTHIQCLVTFEDIGEVPFVTSANTDTEYGLQIYQEIMNGEWGEILPYIPPPEPVLTNEQIIEQKRKLLSDHMDTAARALGYDSIVNAITYADEPSVPKFQAEGKAFRKWRSEVWDTGYSIINEVLAGQRAIPTDDELLNLLPLLQINYQEEEDEFYAQEV